jgi:hypothetical protein
MLNPPSMKEDRNELSNAGETIYGTTKRKIGLFCLQHAKDNKENA